MRSGRSDTRSATAERDVRSATDALTSKSAAGRSGSSMSTSDSREMVMPSIASAAGSRWASFRPSMPAAPRTRIRTAGRYRTTAVIHVSATCSRW